MVRGSRHAVVWTQFIGEKALSLPSEVCSYWGMQLKWEVGEASMTAWISFAFRSAAFLSLLHSLRKSKLGLVTWIGWMFSQAKPSQVCCFSVPFNSHTQIWCYPSLFLPVGLYASLVQRKDLWVCFNYHPMWNSLWHTKLHLRHTHFLWIKICDFTRLYSDRNVA